MPLGDSKPQITAAALAGYFAVLAMEPSAAFYNGLRDEGAVSSEICWAWMSMVLFAADFTVQHVSGIQPDSDHPANRVLTGLIGNIKAVGFKTDANLQKIEVRLRMFADLITRRASSVEIGGALTESVGLAVTNPVLLFQTGQRLPNLLLEVGKKFSFFEIQ